MKKYKVEWYCVNLPLITHVIEADTEDDAFDKAVEKYEYHEYTTLYIKWGYKVRDFANPHNPNYVAPKKPVAGTDGSVGWYENLGESSLSDRDILLAQLHELQTIKRCVVCTILIVIVIPIVFSVINSS